MIALLYSSPFRLQVFPLQSDPLGSPCAISSPRDVCTEIIPVASTYFADRVACVLAPVPEVLGAASLSSAVPPKSKWWFRRMPLLGFYRAGKFIYVIIVFLLFEDRRALLSQVRKLQIYEN
jgi:hypothetical protein